MDQATFPPMTPWDSKSLSGFLQQVSVARFRIAAARSSWTSREGCGSGSSTSWRSSPTGGSCPTTTSSSRKRLRWRRLHRTREDKRVTEENCINRKLCSETDYYLLYELFFHLTCIWIWQNLRTWCFFGYSWFLVFPKTTIMDLHLNSSCHQCLIFHDLGVFSIQQKTAASTIWFLPTIFSR